MVCEGSLLASPVYLYIKTHNKTGLKYFGRTIKDPYRYKGSGLYWLRHIHAHGSDVSTEIFGIYLDKNILVKEATKFSVEHDIVNSDQWANLIVETGLSYVEGWEHSTETREILSDIIRERWRDPQYKKLLGDSQRSSWTPSRKAHQSAILKSMWEDPETRVKLLSKEISDSHRERARSLGQKPKSTYHRENISKSLRGRVRPEQHSKNISLAKQGVPSKIPPGCVWDSSSGMFITSSGFRVQKLDCNYKKWLCVESGDRYQTLKDAVYTILNNQENGD